MSAPEGASNADATAPAPRLISDAAATAPLRFPNELELDFDAALGRLGLSSTNGSISRDVAFDGFHRESFESKRERDRRYGSVYQVMPRDGGYLIQLEMPRVLPRSALSAAWGRDGRMPDYRYTIATDGVSLTIRASVAEEQVRRLAYISRSFPADFQTSIPLEPIIGFVHRLKDGVLEIVALTAERAQNRFAG